MRFEHQQRKQGGKAEPGGNRERTETHPFKGSPMTYLIDGKQYVAIGAGANFLSFALP